MNRSTALLFTLSGLSLPFTAAALTAVLIGRPAEAEPPGTVSLRDAAVVVGADEPSPVRHAAEDLRDFLREAAGGKTELAILHPSDDLLKTACPGVPLILAGTRACATVPPEKEDADGSLSPGAYRIRSGRLDGRPVFRLSGPDSAGVVSAVMTLEQRIRIENGDVLLPRDFQESGAPRFHRRGVYAHQHWAFLRPYALRAWTPEDWTRYVDLLAHLRYNLLQLWTMAGICPHPLSDGDRRFLGRYPPVIDRAHAAWGMDVWPGECANNIAETDKGQPVERREYFDVEVLKNPADPAQVAQIREARRDHYETAVGGDGYWVIDSDPGGWRDSPPSEFVDLLLLNRKLIDEVHPRGKSIPLVYWMWTGWWGQTMPAERRTASWRAVLQDMKKRLSEPWLIHACWPEHLAIVKEEGLLERTVFFPYATGEPEPSAPYTRIRFDEIRKAIRQGDEAGPLLGVMVNFQSPVVQLPHLYYFSRCAWDPKEVATPDDAVLADLARLIAPARAELLARAWGLLADPPVADKAAGDACLGTALALEGIAKPADLGPPGPLGRCLVGGPVQVAQDLAVFLQIRGYALLWAAAAKGGAGAASANLLESFFRSVLAWQKRTGYHSGGWVAGWDHPTVHDAWAAFRTADAPGAGALAKRLRETFRAEGFDAKIVDLALRQTLEIAPEAR